jgi:putative inorganic carbon (HCO3(-)) transporter
VGQRPLVERIAALPKGIGAELPISAIAVALCIAVVLHPSLELVILTAIFILLPIVVPDAVFYTVAATLPLTHFFQGEFPIREVGTLCRLAILIGVFANHLWRGKSIRRWLLAGPLDWLTIAYGATALISVFAAHNVTVEAQRGLLRLASYIAVYFSVTGWLENERQLRTFCKVLLYSTIGVAVFGFVQSLMDSYTAFYWWFYRMDDLTLPWNSAAGSGRITSFLNYSNSLAGYLNLLIPLGIAVAAARSFGNLRKVGFVAAALASVAMVLTQSRGGLLALAGTLLLAVWCLLPSMRMRVILTAAAAAAIPVVMIIVGSYSSRLGEVDLGDASTVGRFLLWYTAWNFFTSSPILGIGYDNFKVSYDPGELGTKLGLDAHNIYLQTLAETGIVGFIFFFAICVVVIVACVKQIRRREGGIRDVISFAALGAVVSVLIHGTMDFLFEVSTQFGAAFWLVIALWVASGRMTGLSPGGAMAGALSDSDQGPPVASADS